VRGSEVLYRPERYDPGGIDVVVRDVIMSFDVVEVDCVGDAVDLVEISQVTEQVGIVGNASKVALEMAVVDGVEPHQRGEQSDVGFGELIAGSPVSNTSTRSWPAR